MIINDELLLSKLEGTRQDLLDLGLRNSLLNFREDGARAIKVVDEIPREVFRILVREKKAMAFLGDPDMDKKTAKSDPGQVPLFDFPLQAKPLASIKIQNAPNFVVSNAPLDKRYTDLKLQTGLSTDTLQKRLLKISYDARASIEGQGVNILYLALGALNWYENENSDKLRFAPLLLLPVEIIRSDVRERFQIRYTEEELGHNLSLETKLKNDFNITLPDLSENDELNVDDYFNSVNQAIHTQPNWKIDCQAISLGFFSFGKFLLYKDLDSDTWPMGEGPRDNQIIRGLLLGNLADKPSPLKESQSLDKQPAAQKLQTVLDADSTQMIALADIMAGRNLVIHGPPGTGKSQTITNLIAEALASGKTVLFVAEKMAALEVVKRRLDDIGLGMACLEIHSHKTNKKAVLTELKSIINSSTNSSKEFEAELKILEQSRSRLNNYCEAINTPIGESGLTPYLALGRLIQFDKQFTGVNLPNLKIAGYHNWSRTEYSELRVLVEELASLFRVIGVPQNHPFWGVRCRSLGIMGRQELQATLTKAIEAVEKISTLSAKITRPLNLPTPSKSWEFTLTEFILTVPNIFGVNVASSLWLDQANEIKSLLSTGAALSELHQHYEPVLKPEAWSQTDLASTSQVFKNNVEYLEKTEELKQKINAAQTWHESFKLLNANLQKTSQIQQDLKQEIKRAEDELASTKNTYQNVKEAVALDKWLKEQRNLNKLAELRGLSNQIRQSIYQAGWELSEREKKLKAGGWKPYLYGSIFFIAIVSGVAFFLLNSGLAPAITLFGVGLVFAGLFGFELSSIISKQKINQQARQYLTNLHNSLAYNETQITNLQNITLGQPAIVEAETVLKELGINLPLNFYQAETRLAELSRAGFNYTNPDAVINISRKLENITHFLEETHIKLQQANLEETKLKHKIDEEQLANKSQLELLQKLPTLKQQMDNWWHEFSKTYNQAEERFNALCKNLAPKDLKIKFEYLDAILKVQQLETKWDQLKSLGIDLFQSLWRGYDSDWNKLNRLMNCLEQLHTGLHKGIYPPGLLNFLTTEPDIDWYRQSVVEFQKATKEHSEAIKAVITLIQLDEGLKFGADGPLVEQEFQKQLDILNYWNRYIGQIGEIVSFNDLATRCEQAGLGEYVKAGEQWTEVGLYLEQAFEKAWLTNLLDLAFKESPVLSSFNRETHEQVISQFRNLDEQSLNFNRIKIASAHVRKIEEAKENALYSSSLTPQLRLLQREIEKKQRHIPLRRLFKNAGNFIQTIKPVFMMSPLSVAAFLEPGVLKFDLVIFDEASQVRPADAFGAILRGQQVVVAGDDRQLPPSNFFAKITQSGDEDEDEDTIYANDSGDFESILTLFRSISTPRMLRWHYRSHHESLIAVSNHEFYENQLIIFPSPDANKSKKGLVSRYLPNTTYDRSKSRTNLREAQAVAEAVMKHAKERSDLSLGVATFSVAQRTAVEEQLELLRRKDPTCENFFASHQSEPFFIKNLENVQGDERDVILISIGYGKDQDGKVSMNFGPLTTQGGERRLNVLISRARRRCEVFTNLSPEDIDLNRTQSRGVKSLKVFLEYARSGTLHSLPIASGRRLDSPFEATVMKALVEKGYEIVPQVGQSGFFIDLAVVDPEKPGRYLLGIECDGASYHSALSARDRDRLRQKILEGLGWRIHRIWSTDWFNNPERELERLTKAIEAAHAVSKVKVKVTRIEETKSSVKVGPNSPLPILDNPNLVPSAVPKKDGLITTSGSSQQPTNESDLSISKTNWPTRICEWCNNTVLLVNNNLFYDRTPFRPHECDRANVY